MPNWSGMNFDISINSLAWIQATNFSSTGGSPAPMARGPSTLDCSHVSWTFTDPDFSKVDQLLILQQPGYHSAQEGSMHFT